MVLLVLLVLLAISSGCGQNETQQIDWQLPLEAPRDPHGDAAVQPLPEWAAMVQGSAELLFLQKDTARRFKLSLQSGVETDWMGMHFRLLGLADGLRLKSGSYIDDKNVHNPAAFVDISRNQQQVYRGWLYLEFPELFGPDMADWKLWLGSVAIKQPADDMVFEGMTEGTSTTGTRP